MNLENVELVTAASVQRQQLTAAKFKQRQLIATFGEVKRALDEWDTELAAWEKTGPPLLKSDEGKKLASDPALVKRFRVVADLDRPITGGTHRGEEAGGGPHLAHPRGGADRRGRIDSGRRPREEPSRDSDAGEEGPRQLPRRTRGG